MKKRRLIIGNYDTALRWTLCECVLGEAVQQTNFMDVPGGIPLDVSTVLTEGEPSYGSRPFNARLECSEGSRADRQNWISQMINQLDGYRLNIVLPDYPEHYITGRVHVALDYNDLVHASVRVTATCDAWIYKAKKRSYTLTATEAVQKILLSNSGRLAVVPEIKVTTGIGVGLSWGESSQALGSGTYHIPSLWLRPGDTLLTYHGQGTVVITYREAILQ